ncbi:uncharacterized protein LODBEIA_P55320 [Lodderomyces beijingensis]|uniref:SMP-LTD domain-containing protein n=1 Tax=Lodderomyces beijingensis TaxID=1775926 RepID=A0ABP0ZT52_9ASCO
MGLLSVLFIYLLGVISCPFLLVITFIYVIPEIKKSKRGGEGASGGDDAKDFDEDYDDERQSNLKAGEIEEKHQSGLESFKNGWIIVTNEYIESTDEINSKTASITESAENKSAYASLYKLVNRQQQQQQQLQQQQQPEQIPPQQQQQQQQSSSQSFQERQTSSEGGPLEDDVSDSVSIASMQLSSPSHLTQSPPLKSQQQHAGNQGSTQSMRQSLKKHRFFAVLKHGNLFLYKDQSLKDVKNVVVLSNYFVTLWPRDLKDASLFTKYTAIALINPNKLRNLDKLSNRNGSPPGSFFIYCDTNSDKEDWYFALIRGTKLETANVNNNTNNSNGNGNGNGNGNLSISSSGGNNNSSIPANLSAFKYAQTLHFSTKEMIKLIQALYSSEGHLQTKWMNALIGRWFLAIKDTEWFENYIYTRLSKKLDKMKKPGFFDTFQITDIYPGSSAPFFTYPSLKEINPDGTVVVSANISYSGGISATIKTKLDLAFGAKFASKEVDLSLKISLMTLEGPILIKMKPPPSNRFWYCYEIEPLMHFKIEPILSNKSLNYPFITSSIEKKFTEGIKESLVLPHWDDIVFLDTMNELYRGGIWKNSGNSGADSNDADTVGHSSSEDAESLNFTTGDDETLGRTRGRPLKNTKFGTALSDLTLKMKKKTTTTNLSMDEFPQTTTTTVSAAPETSSSSSSNSAASSLMSNTFKRIGKWYFKDDDKSQKPKRDGSQQVASTTTPSKVENRRPGSGHSSVSNFSASTINSGSGVNATMITTDSDGTIGNTPSDMKTENIASAHLASMININNNNSNTTTTSENINSNSNSSSKVPTPPRTSSSKSISSGTSEVYHPPEMISNRRPPRKSSNATSTTAATIKQEKFHQVPPPTVNPSAFEHVQKNGATSPQPAQSPQFNFGRLDSMSDAEKSYSPFPRINISQSQPPQLPPRQAGTSQAGASPASTTKSTVTAGSLGASGFLSTFNNLPSSPTYKRRNGPNGAGGEDEDENIAAAGGAGGGRASRSESISGFNLNDSSSGFGANTTPLPAAADPSNIIVAEALTSEPTVGLSQVETPERQRSVVGRKPPPPPRSGATSPLASASSVAAPVPTTISSYIKSD